jgi:hypothetical protein
MGVSRRPANGLCDKEVGKYLKRPWLDAGAARQSRGDLSMDGLGAGCDRQDIGEQTSDGRVGRERHPARLKIESLRGNVFGDQIA